jgi:hypothetical protein
MVDATDLKSVVRNGRASSSLATPTRLDKSRANFMETVGWVEPRSRSVSLGENPTAPELASLVS